MGLKGPVTARSYFLRIIYLYVLNHILAIKEKVHINSLFKFYLKIKFYSFSWFVVKTLIFFTFVQQSHIKEWAENGCFDSYEKNIVSVESKMQKYTLDVGSKM